MTPDEEARVLFPDVDLEVRDPDTGEAVALTVREFRFREGLEAQAAARPLVEALAAAAGDGLEAGTIEAAMAAHADTWLELVARACARDAAWLARLGDDDAHALSDAMWSANGSFFVRRVAARAAAARKATPRAETRGSASRSPASSTRSSAPATDAATTTSPGG